MKLNTFYTIGLLLSLVLTSCHDEWLEIKQDKKQVIPETLDELQALLDNSGVMNINYPHLGELSADDHYMLYSRWETRGSTTKNGYIWAKDIYEGETVHDWNWSFERIFYANTVLDGLDKVESSEMQQRIKGGALFFRAWNYYQLAQLFCKPYDSATASSDLGLPLRIEADITIPVTRSSVQQTYDMIIKDLVEAAGLLPEDDIVYTRPVKSAALALLAKTYLQMNDHEQALNYALQVLEKAPPLLDYNTVDVDASYPLENSPEIIFYSQTGAVPPIYDNSHLYINEELLNAYSGNDLRKTIFFEENGAGGFNGSYSDNGFYFFNGIAMDEVYLIAAESYAHIDQTAKAMELLNTLLENRYITGTFTPLVASDAEEALHLVIDERRKELPFRGIRWADLRRLNKDPRFARTLVRDFMNGEVYELPPNDPRYTMPLPDIVVELSKLQQNER